MWTQLQVHQGVLCWMRCQVNGLAYCRLCLYSRTQCTIIIVHTLLYTTKNVFTIIIIVSSTNYIATLGVFGKLLATGKSLRGLAIGDFCF